MDKVKGEQDIFVHFQDTWKKEEIKSSKYIRRERVLTTMLDIIANKTDMLMAPISHKVSKEIISRIWLSLYSKIVH